MKAINLNRRDYHVTGITRWDDGRERVFDDYSAEPILCPLVKRYGSEVTADDTAKHSYRLPSGTTGYTITILTCAKLTAMEHETEDARTEEHCRRILGGQNGHNLPL